jgi:hypothetical protein
MALAILSVPMSLVAQTRMETVLASESLRDGATLTLYRRDVGLPGMTTRLRYGLNTKPAAGADSDTVFYLSYQPRGSKTASTVWIGYRTVHFAAPSPIFVATLIDDPNEHPFLIFLESHATGASLAVYKVDLEKPLGEAPPILDNERREEWPQPAAPLSSLTYGLSKQEAMNSCVANAIHAEWKSNTITLRAHRDPEVCGSLLTALDVLAKKWSTVHTEQTSK